MSIASEHKEDLGRQIKVHRDRLSTLRAEIEHMQREIRIHELVLALADNEVLLPILDAITDDPQEAARACEDPRGFAASRGLEVPEQLAVSVSRSELVEVRVTYEDDAYPFVFQWDRVQGFTAHQPETSAVAAAT